jgi:uncharacterized membrane protein YhaH (DUF805 family)
MTGLNSFFIEKIPMYNKFRDSKMILILVQVMAAAMGMMFLKKLVEGEITNGEQLNYYFKAFRNYFNFSGRARRSEYWSFFIINSLISFVITLIALSMGYPILSSIYLLFVFVPGTAVAVRRAHDVGVSGWVMLIPFYNIYLACLKGEQKENKYGPICEPLRVRNGKKVLTGAVAVFAIVIMYLYVSPSSTGSMISPLEQEQFDQMAKSAPKEQVAMIDDYSSALQDVRAEIFKADAKRSLFLVLLVSGAVLALVYVKNKTLKMAILPVIGVIALFDGFSVSRRYLNLDKEKGAYKKFVAIENKEIPVKAKAADFSILDLEKPNVADFDNKSNELEQVLKNSGIYDHVKSKDAMKEVANFGALQLNSDFRVARLGNPFNDAETSFFHKSIGGYHGAKLKRMQEVIDFHLAEELDSALAYLQAGTFDSLGGSLTVLNMLNTKYYIGNPEQPALPNKFAMGNAWFVSKVRTTNNSDEEMIALGEIDAKLEATTQASFGTQFHAPQSAVDSTASVRMLAYETKVLRYEVNNTSSEAQPVVFSEIYYPQGWVCRIDGNEVETARVNYVLRGAMVPTGTHTVEWSFEPKVWEKGTTISYAGSALLFALLAFAGFMVYKEEKKA